MVIAPKMEIFSKNAKEMSTNFCPNLKKDAEYVFFYLKNAIMLG